MISVVFLIHPKSTLFFIYFTAGVNKCLHIASSHYVTQDRADHFCKAWGPDCTTAVINSPEEQALLESLLYPTMRLDLWIVFGMDFEASTDTSKACGTVSPLSGGKWVWHDCSDTRPFVCQSPTLE